MGNDTFMTGDGAHDVNFHAGAGDDLFIFGDIQGHNHVDGAGGNWTDVIEINMSGDAAHQGGWTLVVDGHQVADGTHPGHDTIDVHGHDGTIHTDHGDVTIHNVDKIEW